jgi:hypothetical protein
VVANFRNRISMQQNEKSWHGVSEASAPFFFVWRGVGRCFFGLAYQGKEDIVC